MAEDADLRDIPPADTVPKRRARLPFVWIVPVLAALVGVGIVVQQQLNEGPTIRIHFRSAEGVEADRTTVRYKDVEIGKVKSVTLSKDFSRIIVTAKIEKDAEKLITEDAHFWIVKPRVSFSGVSGIRTLFSGNYIRLDPGKSGRSARVFTGLEKPPHVPSDVPGKVIQLRAESLGSLGVGSPVYYRRLNVGQVVYYALAEDGKSVVVQIFLNSPYDRFVTSNTRFWETSGVDVVAGSEGLSVRAESLLSMLVGGVAFETPPSGEDASVPANAVFPLASDRETALSPKEVEADRFALHFPGSVRGLSVGSPVILLGLPVGEVTDIFLEYSPATETIRTRVDIATYRYRFFAHHQKGVAAPAKGPTGRANPGVIQHQVAEKGLRAQLRTGSLISGTLYIALDYFPEAPKGRIDFSQAPPRFPTVSTEALEFQAIAKRLLAKLDKVPVEEIGEETKAAVVRLERTLRRIEEQTLPEAERSFAALGRTMGRVDSELVPGAKAMLEEVRKAATSAERALANADRQLLAPDAPGQQELRDALRETRRAANSIRLLADYLERNPSALIRGKGRENP